jgi:hypothetical protein
MSLERKSNNRRQIAMAVLAVFITSCMVPYQQGPYQQGPYQSGPYQQQGPYQQGPGPDQQGPHRYTSGPSHAMSVVYQPPTKKPEREEIRTFLQSAGLFDKIAKNLNQMFDFPQDVTVVWTECGDVNASWDGQGNIVMCFEMAEFVKALFVKTVKDKKELRTAVMSSLLFVFLHELGHGLIAMYKLPSVGREEDAADQLAGLALIEAGDNGAEIAMHVAQFFRLLALSGGKTPFFDEHSLDAQRYYNLLCLVYGSSPDRLGSMVGDDKLPASRARKCPMEYSKISSAWNSLLKPYARRNSYAGQPSGNRNVPAPNSGYADDSGYADNSGNSRYPPNSGRPAAGRSSHSGDNCAPVCDRFEQCRLWKHDSCMGYCRSNTVDPAKNLLASQWSCPKLGAWMQQLGVSGSSSGGDSGNSGGWTCIAEASVGTANGNGPMLYSTTSAYGNGPNRGAASVKALKDCGALVGAALNLAWLSGERTEGGNCVISRCMQSQ